MKKFNRISLPTIAFMAIIVFSNFQNKPVEYRIVDGFLQYWPQETSTYYLWDGTKSIQLSDRYDMIRFMQQFGFELVSTHSAPAGNSGGFARVKETWVFKK